jgi:hypothetical protein
MKKGKMLLLGIMAVVLISLCFRTDVKTSAVVSMNLQDAEKQAVVKSGITSKGNYSGDCMNLSLKNLKSTPTSITIPAGTVFIADESSEQNILVTQDIICQLKGGESKTLDISGYCCEKNDSAPDDGSTFKTSKHTDEKVLKLAEFLKDKKYETHTIQEAVWCVANGASVSNIYSSDPVKQKELVKFVCDLTGQKETWYTNKQSHEMDEQRRIVSTPVEVNGMLSCDIDKPVYVSNSIYANDGTLIYTMGNPMHFPRKGHYEYEFNLTVEGWEKGKYYVLVKAGEKQLLKQEFEI